MSSFVAAIGTSAAVGAAGQLFDQGPKQTVIAGTAENSFVSVTLDAVFSSVDDISVTVTNEPIESGTDITDNVRDDPDRFQLSGVVTRTPIEQSFSLLLEDSDRHEQAWAKLKSLVKTHKFVTIATPVQFLTNIIIESLTRTRTADTGEAVEFSLKCRQVSVVSTSTVALPTRTTTQGALRNLKKQTPTPATQQQSVFFSLVHGVH